MFISLKCLSGSSQTSNNDATAKQKLKRKNIFLMWSHVRKEVVDYQNVVQPLSVLQFECQQEQLQLFKAVHSAYMVSINNQQFFQKRSLIIFILDTVSDIVPSWRLQKRMRFFDFSLLVATYIPWLMAPFIYLQSQQQ